MKKVTVPIIIGITATIALGIIYVSMFYTEPIFQNKPPEKISEALKEVLKQSGVTTPSSALSVQVQSSLVFTVSLPAQIKESELANIIPTEARNYIPVPITEVSLDYFVLPKKEERNGFPFSGIYIKKHAFLFR